MPSIVTDSEEIQQIVRDAIVDALRTELPKLVRNATRKPYLTKEDLQEWIGWSDRSLQHLRDTRQIPFIQHGRKIVYPTDGIEEFLCRHRIEPRASKRNHKYKT